MALSRKIQFGVFAIALVALLAGCPFCPEKRKEIPQEFKNILTEPPKGTPFSIQGLKIEDLVVGDGAEAIPGMTVTVRWVGTSAEGTVVDSTFGVTDEFRFPLGATPRRVIEGLDKGITGMKVHGKRKLTISPELGWGKDTSRKELREATLVYTVELLKAE